MQLFRERSKLFRKTVYTFDEQFKERRPVRYRDYDLDMELAYCKELENAQKMSRLQVQYLRL
jgi:hypothetical protein